MKKYDYNNTKLSIEQLKEIIEVYLKGRYTYSDIAEIFYYEVNFIKRALNDKNKIESNFGKNVYEAIRKRASLIQKLSNECDGKELIRNHRIIEIVSKDILYVDEDTMKNLEVASLFLNYDGNIDSISEKMRINKNEIINKLHSNSIRELLEQNVICYFDRILEVETALFERNCLKIDNIIKRVAYLKFSLKYKNDLIAALLQLPVQEVIKILNDSYTNIKYRKYLQLDISYSDRKKEMIFDMADLIIESNLSTREVAKLFDLSNYTISTYVNEILPTFSPKKYELVQSILKERNPHIVTNKKIKNIEKMKDLYQNGYSIAEIGKVVSKDQSTVYRNLISSYPTIFEERENKNLTKQKNSI